MSTIPERLRDIELYDPKRGPIRHDLSDNTSQWGMAPAVFERIVKVVSGENLSRYPDIYASSLKSVLVDVYSQYGITSENIIVGNGTDDVLDCLIRAVTNEGDLVAIATPTFPMAQYFSRTNGRNIKASKLSELGEINVDEITSFAPRLIYICSPNNPTGISIPRANIEALLNAFDGFVVIDEAYAEFAYENCLELLSKPRVIIMRTLSKIYSLAGLRIGYGLSSAEVIHAVEAVRGPFKANTIGIEAAITALEHFDWHMDVIKETRKVRDWFSNELRFAGLGVEDSDSNFIYVTGLDETKLKPILAREGFAIRWFSDLDVIGTGARITIAPREITEELLPIITVNL